MSADIPTDPFFFVAISVLVPTDYECRQYLCFSNSVHTAQSNMQALVTRVVDVGGVSVRPGSSPAPRFGYALGFVAVVSKQNKQNVALPVARCPITEGLQ